ncbi:unnamed protein product, partial [Chrysoparadoxa australica]
ETEVGEDDTLLYGVSSMQGWRRNMEDAHIAKLGLNDTTSGERVALFGVFDGHGGKEVAKFCSAHLAKELMQLPAYGTADYPEALRLVFLHIDQMLQKAVNTNDEVILGELQRYKAMPNPSDDVGRQEEADEVSRSVSEANGVNSKKRAGSESSLIGGSSDKRGAANPSRISPGQALDLFDKLLKLGGRRGLAAAETTAGDNQGSQGNSTISDVEELKEKLPALMARTGEMTAPAGTEVTFPANGPATMNPMHQQAAVGAGSGVQPMDLQEEHPGPAAPMPTVAQSRANICVLPEHAIQAGCTSIVVLLVGNMLYIANAGDSRAILCKAGGQVFALSEDHKPTQQRELDRIQKAGGFVTPAGRINGNLNLSRSIGDLKYKCNTSLPLEAQMITSEPDVKSVELANGDEFLVIACDGVWDIMSNQEACDFVRERLANGLAPAVIAEQIFDHCIADDPRKTAGLGGDNMTCLVV